MPLRYLHDLSSYQLNHTDSLKNIDQEVEMKIKPFA